MLTTSKLFTFWRERSMLWCKRPSYSVNSLSMIITIFFFNLTMSNLFTFWRERSMFWGKRSSYSVKILSMVNFFFFFFYYNMPMYPTNKSSSVTQNIKAYTLKSHVIPHKSYAKVLVLEQIKHVNSQLPKVSNKLKTNPTSDHVFKLLSSLMKSNHKVLG